MIDSTFDLLWYCVGSGYKVLAVFDYHRHCPSGARLVVLMGIGFDAG